MPTRHTTRPARAWHSLKRHASKGAGMLALLGLAGPAFSQVGMTPFQVGNIPVTLTYPTAAVSKPTAMGPFNIDVALNAPPREGPHRLVVISHGTGGSALPDHALARSLVLAGFVVAQPLHQGDNFKDTSRAGPEAFETRPNEVRQTIDALAASPVWGPRLRLDRVGVHGMSAGGVTALSLAGAQWRVLNLIRHCNSHPEDEAFCFNGALKPEQRAEREARFARARNVPTFFLPDDVKALHGGRSPTDQKPDPRPDPRIAAVTLAVPVAAPFTPESLARVRIPVGVVRAQQDQVLLPQWHTDHVLRHVASSEVLADLPGAGHFDVLWPWPEAVARETAALQIRGGLPNPAFDAGLRAQAHAKITRFHLQHLGPTPP
ncbi:dienelactone hydrolase [Hydrogenophaga sp.]|uniref:alpha/beta hydrolase family protein n=1 Tax=Hydrogenophaga sp. TaxID=1904254 RepID=UPI002731C1C5|nr:dienelactone hydrolase [Hydrogenophaga sp.]MDP1688351.1 dienelactone hydrolase [Hydrogenophaga sp.]